MSVSDDAKPEDLEDEPEGFWLPVHAQVAEWVKTYGEQDEPD